MTLKFIEDYINEKLNENDEYVRFTYYELKVKNNLNEVDIKMFLELAKNKFENMGYKVYFINDQYSYNGEIKKVEQNEFMVAIKNNERK